MVTGTLAGSHPSSATDKLPRLSVFICKVGTVTFVLSGFSKEPPDKGNVGVQKLAVGLSVSSPFAVFPDPASPAILEC